MVEIARMAEVDISTVSRALANSPRVAEETRKRIQRIVADTGYVVNHGARMLRNRSSRQVLVMLPNIAATFFPEVVLGIEDAVLDHGFSVVVGSTRNDKLREDALARQLLTGAADGIILLNGVLPEVIRSFPHVDRHVVAVSRMVPEPTIPQANIDNHAAMETAVAHLAALGHRRIAHIAGPQTSPTFRVRAEAYEAAMRRAGNAAGIRLVTGERFDIEAGVRAMDRILAGPSRPTAIVCASDEVAMGAMNAARRAGLAIPRDMAFVGFDDISFSAIGNPSLTTIRIPRREMGLAGARMLLQNLDQSAEKPRSITLQHHLIVRESCGGAVPPDLGAAPADPPKRKRRRSPDEETAPS